MLENANPLDALILITATWRLTEMITNEEGAWGIFEYIRNRAGVVTVETIDYDDNDKEYIYNTILDSHLQPTRLSRGITCHYCTSVWVATILLLFYLLTLSLFYSDAVLLLTPLSISTVSIFLNEKL